NRYESSLFLPGDCSATNSLAIEILYEMQAFDPLVIETLFAYGDLEEKQKTTMQDVLKIRALSKGGFWPSIVEMQKENEPRAYLLFAQEVRAIANNFKAEFNKHKGNPLGQEYNFTEQEIKDVLRAQITRALPGSPDAHLYQNTVAPVVWRRIFGPQGKEVLGAEEIEQILSSGGDDFLELPEHPKEGDITPDPTEESGNSSSPVISLRVPKARALLTEILTVLSLLGVPMDSLTPLADRYEATTMTQQPQLRTKLINLLRDNNCPDVKVPEMVTLFDELFRQIGYISLQKELQAKNPEELKQAVTKLMFRLDEEGYLDIISPKPLLKSLANAFNPKGEDIFKLLDESNIPDKNREAEKRGLVSCFLQSQLAYILLGLADVEATGVFSYGYIFYEGHVYLLVPLENQQSLYVDFKSRVVRIIDIFSYYKKEGAYWFLKPEHRLSLNEFEKKALVKKERGTLTDQELLNFLSGYLHIPANNSRVFIQAGALANLSSAYFILGRYPEVIELSEAALTLDSDCDELHINIANAYYIQGRYRKAIWEYKKAPHCPVARLNCGDAYYAGGRYAQAAQAYREVLRLDSNFTKVRNSLGNAYYAQGRYRAAIREYKEYLKSYPNYPDAYFNLGSAYYKLAKYNEGKEAFNNVIIRNPDDAEAYLFIGLAQYNLGRRKEAIQSFRKAIELNSSLSGCVPEELRNDVKASSSSPIEVEYLFADCSFAAGIKGIVISQEKELVIDMQQALAKEYILLLRRERAEYILGLTPVGFMKELLDLAGFTEGEYIYFKEDGALIRSLRLALLKHGFYIKDGRIVKDNIDNISREITQRLYSIGVRGMHEGSVCFENNDRLAETGDILNQYGIDLSDYDELGELFYKIERELDSIFLSSVELMPFAQLEPDKSSSPLSEKTFDFKGAQFILSSEFTKRDEDILERVIKESSFYVKNWPHSAVLIGLNDKKNNIACIQIIPNGKYILTVNKQKYQHFDKSDLSAIIIHELWHPYFEKEESCFAELLDEIDYFIDLQEGVGGISPMESLAMGGINDFVKDCLLMQLQIKDGYTESALKYAEFCLKEHALSIRRNIENSRQAILTNMLQLSLVSYMPFILTGESIIGGDLKLSFEREMGNILYKRYSLFVKGLELANHIEKELLRSGYLKYQELKLLSKECHSQIRRLTHRSALIVSSPVKRASDNWRR
ncbi:MAG: tetratricopeptide repeat protein, partial [Candidatus Omnitrophica bacterium]|nr:tetratricopeptide repeat protein [Candidatus Omnitrophota bacterium]